MSLQIIQGGNGKPAGVFIPMNDWDVIKTNYPDIENVDSEIPDWQKQLLDKRLETIANNSNSIKPIEELFTELDSE